MFPSIASDCSADGGIFTRIIRYTNYFRCNHGGNGIPRLWRTFSETPEADACTTCDQILHPYNSEQEIQHV